MPVTLVRTIFLKSKTSHMILHFKKKLLECNFKNDYRRQTDIRKVTTPNLKLKKKSLCRHYFKRINQFQQKIAQKLFTCYKTCKSFSSRAVFSPHCHYPYLRYLTTFEKHKTYWKNVHFYTGEMILHHQREKVYNKIPFKTKVNRRPASRNWDRINKK